MAGTLTVPSEYEAGLSLILSLSDESLRELQSALDSIPQSFNRLLSDDARSKIKSITPEAVDQITETLVWFRLLSDKASVDSDEFATDVLDAVEAQSLVDQDTLDGKRQGFEQRIIALLESNAVTIIARARALLVDHDHDLCSADIATDVRPIFKSDEDNTAIAAVLVHTLKLTYHVGARIKQFYVSMDTQDLDYLGELVEQGKEQAANLRPTIEASGLRYIDVK